MHNLESISHVEEPSGDVVGYRCRGMSESFAFILCVLQPARQDITWFILRVGFVCTFLATEVSYLDIN